MNKQQLANKIWESANRMRSKIEANEYKIAFLKLMNDAFLHSELTQQWYDASAKDNITQGAG